MNEQCLPTGWVITTLGEIVHINPRHWSVPLTDEDIVSFLPMPDVEAGTGILHAFRQRSWREVKKGYTPFQEGDLLFAKITPCMENGKCAIARGLINGRGVGSTEFHVLRTTKAIHPILLLHFLLRQTYRRDARMSMKGAAGQLRVPETFLTATSFCLPPISEQIRIVTEIEKQFSRLDAAVAALKRVKANLKRYRAAILLAACEGRLVPTEAELARQEERTYEPAEALLQRILCERRTRWEADQLVKLESQGCLPLNDTWKAKYKEPAMPDTSRLTELPEGWCWTTIDQFAIVRTGATPLKGKAAYYENGTVPWVTSGALNQVYVDCADEFITSFAVAKTNAKLFPIGTLLLAMYGEGKTRGKVSELRICAATNQACAALVFEGLSNASKPYIKSFLHKNYEDIRRLSSGGVQPNLNLSLVRQTCIPMCQNRVRQNPMHELV